MEYLRPEKVYEAWSSDRADLGLVSYPEPTKEVTVLPWRKEEMVVAASPYHPLAQKSEVSPEDLEGVDFVGFDEDLPIRRDVDRFLREHHVHVNMTLHFDNMQMIKEAVAHGSGVSIMPARVMEDEVAQGRLVPIPIAGSGFISSGRNRAPPKEALSSRGAGVPGFAAGAAHGRHGGDGLKRMIEPTVRKFSSFEQADQADRVYYASLTPQQRLHILLELIQQHRQATNASEGLARVYRIVKFEDH